MDKEKQKKFFWKTLRYILFFGVASALLAVLGTSLDKSFETTPAFTIGFFLLFYIIAIVVVLKFSLVDTKTDNNE
jgi:F0F1-type ATP synthase assembly protein I